MVSWMTRRKNPVCHLCAWHQGEERYRTCTRGSIPLFHPLYAIPAFPEQSVIPSRCNTPGRKSRLSRTRKISPGLQE
ncbi:hypothetical protein ASZ90_014782 [hydrocarbon metagenome]|uniref:Uncharacterized protein n=1 Tax=hydrocarbon metagenome TaxID=938273 RepID=A0A0W8F3Z0_9ZZZZ